MAHDDDVKKACSNCGYDLRAHVADVATTVVKCPECGAIFEAGAVRHFAEPGIFWHSAMAISFGVPLVLTALEAAEEMVYHAEGAAAWAPSWLKLVDFLGGAIIISFTMYAFKRTRHRKRFVVCGILFFLIYILALHYLSDWIEWAPYRY